MRGMLLSDDDRLRKRVISDLLVNLVVDKGVISRAFGIDFDAYFSDALGKLETPAADGLIELSDTQLRVTELGRVFILPPPGYNLDTTPAPPWLLRQRWCRRRSSGFACPSSAPRC